MGKTILRVLGSTSGLVPGEMFCTSIAVRTEHGVVLLDAGAPVATLLPQAGIDLGTLRAVLLTHWHADHSSGLMLLLQRLWLHNAITAKREGSAPIICPMYGPPMSAHRLDWLRSFHLLPYDTILTPELFPLPTTDVEPGEVLRLHKECTAEMYATTHWKPDHARRLTTENFGIPPVGYGIRMTVGGTTIVYSGDAGAVEDCRSHLEGAKLLVHELGHFHAGDVARMAHDGGVPRLLYVHLAEEYHGPAGSARAKREAHDAGYRGEVLVAHDGLEVEV